MKVAVTGGTGSWDRGVGPVVIAALREAGHEVTNLDNTAPGIERHGFIKVDLTDYGATFAALYGFDAIVQLAANGEPDFNHVSGAARFHVNTLIAYNVFQAAVTYGIGRVVWASSETVLGWPFDKVPPKLLPTNDEDPPIPIDVLRDPQPFRWPRRVLVPRGVRRFSTGSRGHWALPFGLFSTKSPPFSTGSPRVLRGFQAPARRGRDLRSIARPRRELRSSRRPTTGEPSCVVSLVACS